MPDIGINKCMPSFWTEGKGMLKVTLEKFYVAFENPVTEVWSERHSLIWFRVAVIRWLYQLILVGFCFALAQCCTHAMDDSSESGPLALTSSLWVPLGWQKLLLVVQDRKSWKRHLAQVTTGKWQSEQWREAGAHIQLTNRVTHLSGTGGKAYFWVYFTAHYGTISLNHNSFPFKRYHLHVPLGNNLTQSLVIFFSPSWSWPCPSKKRFFTLCNAIYLTPPKLE